MRQSHPDPLTTRFERPGTIPRPGPIGRAVRLAWGVLLAAVVWNAVAHHRVFVADSVPHWTTWIGIAIALMLTPYVINIGWGLNWRSVPRWAVAVGIGAGMVAGRAAAGTWWSEPLGVAVLTWYVYAFGHLGISFLLAAAIATPGCEMRAIPHLWTIATGRPTREHDCPGHISRVDAWERARRDA